MRPLTLLALPAAALCLTAVPAPARAIDENGATVALRVLTGSQTLYDRTQGRSSGAGVDLLFHRGALAFGANLDVSGGSGEVDIYGGALLGGELPLFEHLRLRILSELGAHRLADPGTIVALNGDTRRIDSATLPYGGGRVSLDLLLGGSFALDVGLDALARFDLGRTDTALRFGAGGFTTQRFGGTMLGVGAHLGIRF
ncbi:MAG: hypothetical protein NVSMB23_08520 [Myxococcales bacterium]